MKMLLINSLLFMLIIIQSKAAPPNFNKLSWAENEKRLKECGIKNRVEPKERWFGAYSPDKNFLFDRLGVLISTRHVIFSYRQFDKMVDVKTECPTLTMPSPFDPTPRTDSIQFPNGTTGYINNGKNYLLGDCKVPDTPLNGIIIVELKEDVPLVPACVGDDGTYEKHGSGFPKFKIEDMENIRDNLTESAGNLTQLTNDTNGEYLWEPEATNPLTAKKSKALGGKAISIPVIVGQLRGSTKRETVFGMGYDYSANPPGANKKLAVHSFQNKTKAFCELLGICEKGAHPPDPPTTPTTPTTTEPPPPPTTPTTLPPPTTYYVPAMVEDEEMRSFEIPYERKVKKGGSAKIQMIWILIIGFVWY